MADAPYFANRMLSALSSVFTWATDQGLIPEGHPKPTLKIETYAEHARERYLTPEEFARLGAALRAVEPQNPAPVAVVRVLILTGARLREILHMKWAYVDLDRGIVFLPDSKTGKKPIFLPAAAVAILERQPHLVGNPYVFPGRRPGAPLYSLTNQWATIQENAGLKGVRLHDLRHSFASIGAGQSLGLPVLGRLLGHTEPATTARYAHLADHPLRLAVEAIGGEIDAAMAPQIAPAK
ncbi:tyrosine-type recombinase/integrase [Methylocella sp.]|uniref:tyrosine-type recombinase/integrase n=1 Tax=Methylocella sp. TaxID=1978226 RepID=UPI003C26CF27